MSSDNAEPGDDLAVVCHREHNDAPDFNCVNCEYRRLIQRCSDCDAEFVDGEWWTGLGSTAGNGCAHDPGSLTDDWGRALTCMSLETVARWSVFAKMYTHRLVSCGRVVCGAGKWHCVDHQVALDYQAGVTL